MKPTLVAGLVLFGAVGSLSAANYTWNQEPGDTWQDWANPANWLVDGEPATAAPGAGDTIKQPIKTNGSTWNWDLGGGGYTVDSLSFADKSNINDTYAFRNGSLTVSSKSQFLKQAKIQVAEGATLSLVNAELGADWSSNYTLHRALVSIEDGGRAEIHGDNFLPRHAEFNIKTGGTWLYGKDTTLRNCNANVLWYVINYGTAIFENGLCKFSGTWSAPWQIRQMAGEMVWGGPFKAQNNLYYQIELTGGKVSATGDVTFSYDPTRNNYFKFTDDADLDLDVADGKTLDLTPFTYAGAATLRKTGAGALKLADVPTAISMHGGPVTFAANSQTAMTSLDIGEGQAFTISVKNTTIDKLVAVDGSLTLSAGGLTIAAYEAATVAGTIAVTKAAYAVGDILISTPSAVLRAAVKAAAEKAEMNVEEDGETLKVALPAYVFNSTTVTDLGEASGWASGELPPEGADVAVVGMGVKALGTSESLARFKSISISDGAELQVAGVATLPTITLNSTAALTITAGAEATLTELYTLLADGADPLTTLPSVSVAAEATLKVPGGTTFKNVAIDLKGTIAKVDEAGVVSTSGVGPIFGYATAGETSYIAFTSEGGRFEVHSNQEQANGQINFVNPAAGGRVKVVGDIVLKNVTIPINGWVDFGNRIFGENNPTDEPFTVVLDETTLNAPWSFTAAGAAHIRLINGSVVQKALACVGHWFLNSVKDRATVEVVGANAYFDYVGSQGAFNVNSADADVDAVTVRDGGIYLVGNADGGGKGVFVAANGFLGVGKQWGGNVRSALLTGFGSGRIEAGSTLTVAPMDKGIGNTDWERRTQFANIPLTGEGDLIIANSAPTKVFTVTVVNGANTCTGVARVDSPVVEDGAAAAETALLFADGANWAGTVVANGYLSLANPDDETAAAAVTFGKVKLTTALPLRVRRAEDGSIVSDTVTLTDGFVVEDGDAGVVELVPQDDFVLGAKEEIPLGTFPKGAFAHVTVKLGNRTLKVAETPTGVEGVVTCSAKPASGFQIIIR